MTDKEFEKLLDEVAGERAERPEQKPDPRFTEKTIGRTPSGGAYAVAYYYDNEGNPCPKAQAARVNIIEYSEDGKRLNETYAVLE